MFTTFIVTLMLIPWGGVLIGLYVCNKFGSLLGVLQAKIKEKKGEAMVSIIIAAHNEEKAINKRIEDIFRQNYPQDKIEIIVGSDGSADHTVDVVKGVISNDKRVKMYESQVQIGKANIHNKCIKVASNEIIVFTDADGWFDSDFLSEINKSFYDSRVGYITGKLIFANKYENKITENSSIFWKYEQLLRKLESGLGVLVFGSGTCCAVRKELFKELDDIGDADYTTPIDVVLQGYKCKHVEEAVAYDVYPDTEKREFNSRVRMVSKNLLGTIRRWGWKNLFVHPVYSMVIVAHKILRWLFPVLFITHLVLTLFIFKAGIVSIIVNIVGIMFILATLIYKIFRGKPTLFSYFYNFVLVNVAFIYAVYKVVVGDVKGAYQPINKVD